MLDVGYQVLIFDGGVVYLLVVNTYVDISILLWDDYDRGDLSCSLNWVDDASVQHFIDFGFYLLSVGRVHWARSVSVWECADLHGDAMGDYFGRYTFHINI